jgi:hypothetical protein
MAEVLADLEFLEMEPGHFRLSGACAPRSYLSSGLAAQPSKRALLKRRAAARESWLDRTRADRFGRHGNHGKMAIFRT